MAMLIVKLALKDNLSPFLKGMADYIASCGWADGPLPSFPANVGEVMTGKASDASHGVILFPSKELVDWYAAFVAMTKQNPARPAS